MANFSESSCRQPEAGHKTPPVSCVWAETEDERAVSSTPSLLGSNSSAEIIPAVNTTKIIGVCRCRCAHVHRRTTQTQITGQKLRKAPGCGDIKLRLEANNLWIWSNVVFCLQHCSAPELYSLFIGPGWFLWGGWVGGGGAVGNKNS